MTYLFGGITLVKDGSVSYSDVLYVCGGRRPYETSGCSTATKYYLIGGVYHISSLVPHSFEAGARLLNYTIPTSSGWIYAKGERCKLYH